MSEYQPIETAPLDKPLMLRTRGGSEVKAFWGWGICEGEDGTVSAWAACDEGEHPPCWTDGICWASNEDEKPSDPPVSWKPIEDKSQ